MRGPGSTAGEMLADVVADLVARVDRLLPGALADEPDGVHQLRTAVRRLRSVLAAFAPYVEPAAVGALRAGLADLGLRLGVVRDLEVRVAWCERSAAEAGLDPSLTAPLVEPLRDAHRSAHAELVAWAGSAEAGELLRAVHDWAGAPALATDGSARPASVVAEEVLDAEVARVLAHGHDLADEESAHELRKSGRRLRHVADAVTTPPAAVLGKPAVAVGELGARLQSLLGDHRDALLLAAHVRASMPDDAAARAAYAPLLAAADRAAAAALDGVPPVLADLAELSGPRDMVSGWTSGSAS